jgi:heptaprenyl diphosphate synthase
MIFMTRNRADEPVLSSPGEVLERTRRLVFLAFLVCLAAALSYLERLIPLSFAVPGVKPGLANLAIVSGLYILPFRQALLLVTLKCFMTAWIFGSFSAFLYSAAGSLLSFGLMSALLYASRFRFPVTALSVAGAIGHNAGQLLMAAAVVKNAKLFYYMPVLAISGAVTGWAVGCVVRSLLPQLPNREGWR